MEVGKPRIKSMKYEDFNDNEYIESMIRELREHGTNVRASEYRIRRPRPSGGCTNAAKWRGRCPTRLQPAQWP